MKKKILAAAVCAAMVLSLTACGKSEEPVNGISSQTESSGSSETGGASSTPEQNSSETNSSSSTTQSSNSTTQSSSSTTQSSSSTTQSSSSTAQSSSSKPQSSSSKPQSSSSKPQSSSSTPQSSSSKPQSSSSKPQSSSSKPQSSSSKPQSSSSTTTTPTPTTNVIDWSKIPYADEFDFNYENCDGGVKITGYTGSETILKMPETINGKPVVRIGNKASGFRACTDIKVPSKVTVLEDRCFYDGHLKSVDLPNELIEIEDLALGGNKIERVIIPDTVTRAGYFNIRDMSSDWGRSACILTNPIKEIVYKGKTYDEAHHAAFYDTVNLDASGMIVEDGILKRVSRATIKFVVPSDVKEIDTTAFNGCLDLTSVTIPEGVTKIWGESNHDGFQGCTKLKSLSLPDSLTSITKYGLGVAPLETVTWKGRTYKPNQFERLCQDVCNQ